GRARGPRRGWRPRHGDASRERDPGGVSGRAEPALGARPAARHRPRTPPRGALAVPAPGDDWYWCPRCREPLERGQRGGPPRPARAACGFAFFATPGVGAAWVVRDAEGRVLLVRRSAGQFGAGKWCFPCGFVEWGEDVRDAARREALEEAGI